MTEFYVIVWSVRNLPYFLSEGFLRDMRTVVLVAAPFALWVLTCSVLLSNYRLLLGIAVGVATGIIAIRETRRGALGAAEIGIAVGAAASLAAMPFWFDKLGLSVVAGGNLASLVTRTVRRGGMGRFAGGQGDYNFLGLTMCVGIAGLIHVILRPASAGQTRFHRYGRYLAPIQIVLCVPAVMATISRAAIFGIAVAVLCPIVIQLLAVARAERVRVLKWLSLRLAAGMVVVAAVVLISSQDITSYWQALVTYQEQKTLFEGREFVLSRAVEGIRANPVTGYLEVGMEEEFAHNTFLDAGAYAGMPGLVLFAILTLFPLIFAFRKQGLVVCGPVLSEYLLALYAMLSLSLMYYKVFWVTWSILLYYAHRGSAVTTVARAPALLRAPPVSGTA